MTNNLNQENRVIVTLSDHKAAKIFNSGTAQNYLYSKWDRDPSDQIDLNVSVKAIWSF